MILQAVGDHLQDALQVLALADRPGQLIEQVAGQPGALPLLEYTLAELWKECQPNGIMIWNTYRRLGGVVCDDLHHPYRSSPFAQVYAPGGVGRR